MGFCLQWSEGPEREAVRLFLLDAKMTGNRRRFSKKATSGRTVSSAHVCAPNEMTTTTTAGLTMLQPGRRRRQIRAWRWEMWG